MLLGKTEPRICSIPEDIVSSAGDEAIELAAIAGLLFDPWQCFVLKHALGEREDGKWAASEVGLVVPRQNGKGSILEGRELAGLFLFEEELLLHSAHEFKTAREGFLRIQYLLNQSDELSKRVGKVATAHGAEGIELKPKETIIMGSTGKFIKRGKTPRLNFVARSGGSGRGFTGDVVILDEAYRLPDRVMTALLPTLSARQNPQIWYTSSAVNQEEHDQGEQLARVRDRGIKKASPRLCYMEWSIDEDEFEAKIKQGKREGKTWREIAAQREYWAETNPGLGYRVSEEAVETELQAFKQKAFTVERLCIGDWPDLDENRDDGPITRALWKTLRDDSYKHDKNIVFAVDVSVDRKTAAVMVFSEDDLGIGHIELVKYGNGTEWIVPWLVERKEKWKPLAIGVDGKSPTASLVEDMKKAGLTRPRDEKRPRRGDVIVLSLQDMADATGQFLDACTAERLNYYWDADLDSAVHGAELRKVGDVHVWGRREITADVSPLTAGTIARWVYLTHKDRLLKGNQPTFAFV